MKLHHLTLAAITSLLINLHLPARGADRPPLHWQKKAGSLALLQGEQCVWQFNFGTNETKPCFHPVALPGGPALTLYRPPDHPWHRALWFSWKYINGTNYWEEDPKTGLYQGSTEWRQPRIETRPDFSSKISLSLTYRPQGGEGVLEENRTIEVSKPEENGDYRMDWTMRFKAGGQDVVLDRTPSPGEPGGVPWGGYAGLSIRFAHELEGIKVITSEGPIEFRDGTYRGKATAMDYTGTIQNREAGIAVLDHSQNLNAPSPWYAIRNDTMSYFSPAVLCYHSHTLKARQTLTLRYRLIVHSNRWTPEHLRAVAAAYSSK